MRPPVTVIGDWLRGTANHLPHDAATQIMQALRDEGYRLYLPSGMGGIHEGDTVEKTGGDYYFKGEVINVFVKKRFKDNPVRFVVENADGVCHIFSEGQLTAVADEVPGAPRQS